MTDKTSLPAGAPNAVAAPRLALDLLLDTNVVLDLWLFQDPRLQALREALAARRCRWLASLAMLEELGHVRQRGFAQRYPASPELLNPPATLVEPAANPAPWRCRDADDQKFLDLAWQRQLPLWTRDRDLLSLARKAARRGLAIETPEAGLHRLS